LELLKEGDTILDPMAGTGMTNICAGAMGYKSISVELEEKFIGFEKQNKEYAERRLYKDLDWQIIQGDSRRLSELLSEKGLVSVTSPPFYQSGKEPNDGTIGVRGRDFARNRYGTAEGQIGNLKDMPLKSILSPPYEQSLNPQRLPNIGNSLGGQTQYGNYGTTEGQIGNLPDTPLKAITSPPYAESIRGGKSGIDWQEDWGKPSDNRQPSQDISYSEDTDNIGNLPDKPLKSVMSPPYEESTNSDNPDKRGGLYRDQKRRSDKTLTATYGEAEGQVGCEKGESYLSAMLQVYKEIARVSDVLVVVIKNPTRNGKLRRLDLDTIKIMQMAGWNIHCQHRALLFEELEQSDLFGGKRKQVKGRLSFFKRLSWQKGQPVASWEDVIVAIRQIVLIGDRDTRSYKENNWRWG